jgi:hypothetical protein
MEGKELDYHARSGEACVGVSNRVARASCCAQGSMCIVSTAPHDARVLVMALRINAGEGDSFQAFAGVSGKAVFPGLAPSK